MSNVNIVERIAKMLNQAERAGTEAEAAAFMKKVQEMSTEYSVDLAVARSLTESKVKSVPTTVHVKLGQRKARGLNTMVALIGGIAQANNLRYNVAHNSTFVNLFGFQEDIDITLALFASLSVQMVTASEVFKKEGTWQQDTTYRPGRYRYFNVETGKTVSLRTYERSQDYYSSGPDCDLEWIDGTYKPVSWLSARLDFQQAFAERVGTRLYLAKLDAEKKVVEQTSTGTELVLANKALEVSDFYKRTSNHRGSYRGHRDKVASYTSQAAGDRAGSNARLSASKAIANKRAIS